jgi:sodium borate transporter 11
VQKGTKTALETSRTFATLFADMDIRQRLVVAQNVEQFRHCLLQAAKEMAVEQNQWKNRKNSTVDVADIKNIVSRAD